MKDDMKQGTKLGDELDAAITKMRECARKMVERDVEAQTSVLKQQAHQFKEQRDSIKAKRAVETKKLRTERDQALAELGQLKRQYADVVKERDALRRKVSGR